MNETKRKKILFLITKSNWGGAQRYVFDIATNLDTEHFDVTVALGGNGRLRDELQKKNVATISLKNLERDISLMREFRAVQELWHIIRNVKPDVLHINSSKAGALGALIGRLLFVPTIIFTAHGWAFNENRPHWQKVLIKISHWITIILAHKTIVVSEATKAQMNLPFIKRKMFVIHNGRTQVDHFSREYARGFFLEFIPSLQKYADDFWSVTIAELHPIKQHEVTIQALAEIVHTHPSVRHIIIGDGEERDRLEALVIELGMGENVFFAGPILEASRYLKAFDLFVLASRSEALAYVIIEACIAGLPIIASAVGGIPEIVTSESQGFLFPQGNIKLLSELYRDLYEQPVLRDTFSKNAYARAIDFSFEKMLEKTVALYDQK